ncbi:hypothetical protein KHQ81_10010 [Mycoplasmatota bacterium]|nr:hypothetical protein KHQ81_10010 [Mycoplasmatota bacterium]
MKDNKPLLFINSAQSSQLKGQNQYVYDSRFDNSNQKFIRDYKKDVRPAREEKKKQDREEVKTENTRKRTYEERNSNIKLDQSFSKEDEIKKKKLMNKMVLLNKRANLGRYVLVSIEKNNQSIECYFIKLLEKSIIVSIEDKEQEILMQDIEDIIILKV